MFASFVIASLVVASAEPPKADDKRPELSDAAKKELKKLEGKWQVVTLAHSAGAGDVTEHQYYGVFEGTTATFSKKGKDKEEVIEFTALDPGASPKCIDLTEHLNTPGRAPRTMPGVYKLDGDVLLLAFAAAKAGAVPARPVGFDKPTEPGAMVWTLKRVKD